MAFPIDTDTDEIKSFVGPRFTLGGSCWFNDNLAVTVDGSYGWIGAEATQGPLTKTSFEAYTYFQEATTGLWVMSNPATIRAF